MKEVIIFGITDLAEVLAYNLENDEQYKIAAITVDKRYLKNPQGGVLQKYPCVPFETIEQEYPNEKYEFFICVGYSHMNEGRKSAYQRIKEKGYRVLTYIHPTALVQTHELGEGNLVFENVTIGSFCSVGVCNIFYPCSHVAHHTEVGDYNFFAISCSVAGHVQIGNQCFIGNNSSTRDKISISDKTLIGAGAYMACSTEPGDVFVPERSVKLAKKSDQIEL